MNRMMRCWLTCAVVMLLAASGSARAVEVGPESVVYQLYKDFGIVSLFDIGGDGITGQPPNVLAKYFDAKLTRFLMDDQACVMKTNEECAIDFDILFCSQDANAESFLVKYIGNGVVRVSIGGQKSEYESGLTVIDYKVKKFGSKWLIDDIIYNVDGNVFALTQLDF